MNFADRLQKSIKKNNSFLVAGFDPRLDTIPECIKTEASKKSSASEDELYHTLTNFHQIALEVFAGNVAAVKPNIAFFEQYGVGGIRAFRDLLDAARDRDLPVVVDAKRGDIGSTAEAYANAFLAKDAPFSADAITVNPFLGFDTLEPFLRVCKESGTGIFVLVKTSNPGASDLQDPALQDGGTISARVADWLSSHAEELMGDCGYSSLGAVVGATYPQQAKALRERMPNNFFLVPGLGSQGGDAGDATASFAHRASNSDNQLGGAIINVSRGLLNSFSTTELSREELRGELTQKMERVNSNIHAAL